MLKKNKQNGEIDVFGARFAHLGNVDSSDSEDNS